MLKFCSIAGMDDIDSDDDSEELPSVASFLGAPAAASAATPTSAAVMDLTGEVCVSPNYELH